VAQEQIAHDQTETPHLATVAFKYEKLHKIQNFN